MTTPERKRYLRQWYEKRRRSQSESSREKREALSAAGLCQMCARPSEGATRCAVCAARRSGVRKQARAAKTMGGKCTLCGGDRDEEGKKRCRSCRQRTGSNERERKEQYRRENRCTRCGESAVGNGCAQCQTCYLKQTASRHLGSWHAWEVLLGIFLRQSRLCAYTEWPLVLGVNTELDHRVPKTRGGDNHPDNLQWTHITANRMKHAMTDDEFILIMRAIATTTAGREIVP